MSAIATLKALLTMDTSGFKAGTADAGRTMSTLSDSLNKSGRDMERFNRQLGGMEALLSGNLRGALQGFVKDVEKIPASMQKAIAAVAAFGAGFAAGKRIDEAFGISDVLSGRKTAGKAWQDWTNKQSGIDIDQNNADQRSLDAMREQRRGRQAAEKEKALSDADRKQARMDARELKRAGSASSDEGSSLRAVGSILARQLAQKETAMGGATGQRAESIGMQIEDLRDAIEDNRRAQEKLIAAQESERAAVEKDIGDARAKSAERVGDMRDAFTRTAAGIGGKGISADAMAKTGGFTGPQRADLGIVDRRMRVEQERMQLERQVLQVEKELVTRVAELAAKLPNTGGQL